MLVDTHTHLYLNDFDADREEVLQRAFDAGVRRLLLPAVDSSSYAALRKMASDHPGACFAMAGLHPTSVDEGFESELAFVKHALAEDCCVAVGEIGLDLYWDTTFLSQQIDALRCQLEMACDAGLPVVLHLRSAKMPSDGDAYELFFSLWGEMAVSRRPATGVMHCFSGTVEQALRAVELGFYVGVGGVVTYKKSMMQQVVERLPVERMLLETDAPYLAPVPWRGKRNESAYVVEVARKVAGIKRVSYDAVAHQTTLNAERLFRLPR